LKATESISAADAGLVGWTRDLARDLFPGPTTPFAWTLLAGPADAALRNLYAEFGSPIAVGPLWRLEQGYVYLNSAAVAAADEKLFGAAWLGRAAPPAPAGLLGRMQAGGTVKRVEARTKVAAVEAAGLETRLARWLAWVQGLKWTQADVLQVMEELEPHAVSALNIYFLTRAALNAADAKLRARLAEWLPGISPDLLAGLYLAVDDLPSVQTALNVAAAAQLPADSPERLATLARCGYAGPDGIRPDARRWGEAEGLLESISSLQDGSARLAAALAARREAERGVRARLNEGQARQFDELLARAREAMRAADVAWDGMVMLMAAAQRWAGAAAREALLAGLIARPDDVLFLELEELKQVATGEWHAGRSGEAQAEVARRMAAPAVLRADVCIGAPVEVAPGARPGPFREYSPGCAPPPPGAVWVGESLDPGCLPLWLDAAALLATGCDVWAPGLIAARGLGIAATVGATRDQAAG
jgi:hypothetical protein